MAIPIRNVTIKGVFAEDANTTIPAVPVSGISYRDTNTTAAEMEDGFPFKTIVDSSKFNEMLFEYSTISKMQEKYGFVPWSSLTDYEIGSCCLGTDGRIYQAKQASGPSSTDINPVNDTGETYWGKVTLGGQVRNIGETVSSTVPQTDAGLHLPDGSLLSGSGSYSDFVDYMADLYDSGSYANLFTTEANWQTSVTNYGSCGKYVYDSVNNTVRLPKYTSKHGALIYKNSSGNSWIKIYEDGWCEQGNITSQSNQSTVTLLKSFVDTNYDVLITTNDATYANYSYACAVAKTTSTFNISVIRSASGITAFVYWEAKGYVDVSDYQKAPIYEYVVVATSTKTNIEVDIDEIATDLNGKTDVDLSNCTKPHVVETYNNGTDWYRIWSDGWCEQGGICGDHNTNSLLTVNLLVEYANTNYHVSKNYNGSNNTPLEDDEGSFFNKTTTTMQTYCRGTSDIPSGQYSTWEAKGYIS